MNILLDSDNEARRKIVHDIHKNYFVEASAGSGKTFSLTRRMISLVENGVDVSKICTITFTKAAANEFFERFQSLLSERTNPTPEDYIAQPYDLNPTTEVTRKYCMEALKKIDLCFMGTIDAFCNMLVKEHPAEIGIPSSSEIASNDFRGRQLKKIFREVLNGDYGDSLKAKAEKFRNSHDPNKTEEYFATLMSEILEKRDSNFIYPKPKSTDVDTMFSKHIQTIKEIVEELEKNPEYLVQGKKTSGSCKAYKIIINNATFLKENWSQNIATVKKTLGEFENLRFTEEVKDSLLYDYHDCEAKKTIKFDKKIIEAIINSITDYIYSITMDFLDDMKNIVSEKLKKMGILTYFDYLYHLRNSLKDDASKDRKLAKHILERHSYFLVDESQDTNPLQTELLFYITSTNASANWKNCIPKQGSLFIVGDPKQSIYKFRGADVNSYQSTKHLFEQFGEVLYLTRNYRSNKKIREWLNSKMPNLFENAIDEKCEHKDIPIDDNPQRYLVENQATLDGIYKYENNDVNYLVELIEKMVNNEKYLICAKKDKQTRKIKYSDFMIITNNKKALDKYISEFKNHNIPLVVEGSALFKECTSLEIIKKFLKVFAVPTEKIYYIELLKSEYYDFSDKNIMQLAKNNFSFSVLHPINTGIDSIDKVINQIYNLYQSTKSFSYSGKFQYLIENLNLFEEYGVDYLEYLHYALEIIRDGETQGVVKNASDFISLLENINSGSNEYERTIQFGKEMDSVKIANVHKVKGLQAPIVILAPPKLSKNNKSGKGQGNHIIRDNDRNDCYIFKISPQNIPIISTTAYKNDIETLAENSDHDERLRVAYVAATRAEAALIIYKGEAEDNPWKSLIEEDDDIPSLPDFGTTKEIKEKKYCIKDIITEGENNKEKVLKNIPVLSKASYAVIKPSKLKLIKKDNNTELEQTDIEMLKKSEKEQNAALKGTLIHRLMEGFANSRGKCNLEELCEKIVSEFDAQPFKELLLKVGNQILHGGYTQSNGKESDILKIISNAKSIYSEIPFSYQVNETIYSGVVDLIYEDSNGYHIVDYKTNYEGNINVLEKEYSNQLNTYKSALKQILNLNCDARIYHIDISE